MRHNDNHYPANNANSRGGNDGGRLIAELAEAFADNIQDEDLSYIVKNCAKRAKETPPGGDRLEHAFRGLGEDVLDRLINDLRRQNAQKQNRK